MIRYERESFVISGWICDTDKKRVRGEGRNALAASVFINQHGGRVACLMHVFQLFQGSRIPRCYSFDRFTGSRCIVRIADIVIGFDAFPVSF